MFGDKIKGFEPYIPFTYTEGQVRLDANESPYDLPADIKNKIYEGIKSLDLDRYPDPNATELCRAFADYYGVDPQNVVAGNGSDELLSLILSVSLNKGAKVSVVKPDFSMYAFYSTLGQNNVNVFSKGYGDTFDPMAFAEASRGSDIAIFSNPCNPTGSIVKACDVLRMADATDALLIVDEAYMDFSDQSVIKECAERENLMVLKTLSKSFGCAAVRVGFAVSSKKNINVIKTLKSPYNLNSVSQLAGKLILSDKALAEERVSAIKASRNALYAELKKYESNVFAVYPTEANFVYVKTDKAADIAKKLLEKGIVVRCFNDALRIAAGLKEENEKLFTALKEMELS